MNLHQSTVGLAFCLFLMTPWATPADAQEAQLGPVVTRPRPQDVSRAEQERADELLRKGNDAFLKENNFTKAVKLYRQSLEIWDHPGTHYNLLLALLNLDRPVEAYAHVLQALRAGKAPLGEEKYAHALLHKEALESRLARVEIICETPDAVVTIGNERIHLKEGRYAALMLPGPAALVATKTGYVLRKKDLTLLPGQPNRIRFRLYTEEELISYKPRWAKWKSWAVVGAGAAVAAGGGLLYLKTRDDYRAFDLRVSDCAQGTVDRGCRAAGLAPQRSRAELMHKVSFGAMAAGSAALVTGAVLVLLNRSVPYSIDPDKYEQEQGVSVMPLLGAGTTGVTATFQF
ncbi:MAG: carboxypeptidase regulatory-like domain-containing protein [Myxococcaceae bacterium]|nr:carboxypeptidase regulatory-like domain-containing protein [Myxococcaceae bacterium]